VSQEQERKRIAGELHDGLGQQLLIIKNRAALGLDYTEADSNIAAAHKQLAEILSSTTDAISQTREIAYALRPLHLERLGLTSALEEMIDNVAAATGISFDVEIIELGDLFSIDEQINLFRIVQESINNIVKHSEAKHAGVFITRDKDSFEIKITDDGKGFDVIKVSGKKGLGLTSIAERARILGATYHLESTPETGTMILLKLDIIQT
jgi:signal transduction histidine kinase